VAVGILDGGITIAPVHGLHVTEPMPSPIRIGDRVVLEHFEKLPNGKNWRKYFGVGDCHHLEDATLALRNSFAAAAGQFEHQHTRDAELEIMRALLALWICRPTSARVTHFFHFRSTDLDKTPAAYNRLYHTFFATRNSVAVAPAELISHELSQIYQNITEAFAGRKPLRIALWHLFSSQRMPEWETRFVSLCVVLESLFSSSPQEITHKLSERVAMFLHGSGRESYSRFKEVKQFYVVRSKIVHGQDIKLRTDDGGMELIESLEIVVHLVLKKILADNKQVEQFNGKKKEEYLTRLVFESGSAV
jgi:hypothetical protein